MLWGETVGALRSVGQNEDREKYRVIFERFSSVFGGSQVLIDSSKVPEALELLVGIDFVELKVIHLVRDFRGWLVSMQDPYRRNGVKTLSGNIRKRGLKGIGKYFQRSPFYDAFYWLRVNSKIQEVIDKNKNNLEAMMVTYEDLCFDTELVHDTLCKFIGRDIPLFDSVGSSSANHNIFGNRMCFDSEKLRRVRYDRDGSIEMSGSFHIFCILALLPLIGGFLARNRENNGWDCVINVCIWQHNVWIFIGDSCQDRMGTTPSALQLDESVALWRKFDRLSA